MTEDHIMRAVIDAKRARRRKGWKTSAEPVYRRPEMTDPKYGIGEQFNTRGKASRLCTITDILRTYNSAGDLVRVRYVATHQFMGQTITDNDVCETTVAMGFFV